MLEICEICGIEYEEPNKYVDKYYCPGCIQEFFMDNSRSMDDIYDDYLIDPTDPTINDNLEQT